MRRLSSSSIPPPPSNEHGGCTALSDFILQSEEQCRVVFDTRQVASEGEIDLSDNIIHLAWFPVILPRSVWKLLTYLKNSVRLFFFLKKSWWHQRENSINRRNHAIMTNTGSSLHKNRQILKKKTYIDQFFHSRCSSSDIVLNVIKKSYNPDVCTGCIFLSFFPSRLTQEAQNNFIGPHMNTT